MEPGSVSAADECLTWKLATKLGPNSQNAPQDEQAVHLAAHRWAWFASGDREWRAGFERHVKRRLEAHMGLHLEPGEDDAFFVEVWEEVHNALWLHGGDLSELKKRATAHYERGLEGCQEKCAAPRTSPLGLTSRLISRPTSCLAPPAFHCTSALTTRLTRALQ